ncbi:MAG: hypothetical protein ACRYG7_47070 [Janthinobacterium lividum]
MNSFSFLLGSPSVRRLLLAVLLSGSARPGAAQKAPTPAPEQQLTVDLTTPDKPGSLAVKLVNGSIHVKGYAGKSVVIEAVGRARPAGEEPADRAAPPGMKRLSTANSLTLTAKELNNHIELETDSYRHAIDLTIKVPLNFSLKLDAVNGGDIVVENVRGELELSNVNGAILLSQVSGSAVANTINGNLTATFSSVTAGAPMAFSSLTGKVDVTFPSTIKASLKLKSDRGQVYSDFDVALDKSAPKVTRTTQNGLSRLSTDPWTYGTLNGGGADIMLKSMNGSIFLRKAK